VKASAKSRAVDAEARKLLTDDNVAGLHTLAAEKVAGPFTTVEFKKYGGLAGNHDLRNDLKGVATVAAAEGVTQWVKGARGSFYADVGAVIRKALDDHRREGGLRQRVTQRGGYNTDERKFNTDDAEKAEPRISLGTLGLAKEPTARKNAGEATADKAANEAARALTPAAPRDLKRAGEGAADMGGEYRAEKTHNAENVAQSSSDKQRFLQTGAECKSGELVDATYGMFAGRAFGEGFALKSLPEKQAIDYLWANHKATASLFERIIKDGGKRAAEADTIELAVLSGTRRFLSRHLSRQAWYEREIREGFKQLKAARAWARKQPQEAQPLTVDVRRVRPDTRLRAPVVRQVSPSKRKGRTVKDPTDLGTYYDGNWGNSIFRFDRAKFEKSEKAILERFWATRNWGQRDNALRALRTFYQKIRVRSLLDMV